MTVFDTRSVTITFRSASFTCPECAGEQPYHHQKVRKYLALFTYPVVPLRQLGEYVECQHCQGTYALDVLQRGRSEPDHTERSVHELAMRHTMVLMMLADGEVDDNELDTVLEILNRFSKRTTSLIDLEVYVEQVRRQPQPLGTYLRRVAPSLNDHGKETIIRCAMAVASADGKIDREEVEVIREMARTLELTSDQLHHIVLADGAVAA